MGEKVSAPDRDPFAFDLQPRLLHCNIRNAAMVPKKTPVP